MLVYPKFTALDLVGPQHVFALLEGYRVRLVWKDTKEVVSDTGIPIRPTTAFKDCPEDPAVIFVPGGTDGTLDAMEDKEIREFLAAHHREAAASGATATLPPPTDPTLSQQLVRSLNGLTALGLIYRD